MDDVVIARPAPTPIPILSPTLHCVAMTALVYLRTSFGYTFLRPKSIFFAFSWAFALGVVIAWNEPEIWREYRAVCIFATGAIVLYWFHLLLAFSSEWRRRAKDDHYPGTSHATRLARQFGFPAIPDEALHLFIEPAAVLFVSGALRLAFGERHLSAWLCFVALCMAGREAINHWTNVRREKMVGETMKKVKEQGDLTTEQTPAAAPKPIRKEPVEMKRNSAAAGQTAPEERFARILHLRSPYTLDKAEENYRTLIRLEHPDTHENSAESNAATAELNEAIEFFRKKLAV